MVSCFPRWIGIFVAIAFSTGANASDGKIDEKALTRLVTAEVDSLTTVQVVGEAEMRDALNLEAERQAIGCTDRSCIAEVASAMGSSHVLQMQLGAVGTTLLLTTQIFDENAQALSRQSIRGQTLDEIEAQLRPSLSELLKSAGLLTVDNQGAAGSVPRLLVLDLQTSVQRAKTGEAPADPGFNPTLLLGFGVTGAGLLLGVTSGILAGVLVVRNAAKQSATQREVQAWQIGTWVVTGLFAAVTTGGLATTAAGLVLGE